MKEESFAREVCRPFSGAPLRMSQLTSDSFSSTQYVVIFLTTSINACRGINSSLLPDCFSLTSFYKHNIYINK